MSNYSQLLFHGGEITLHCCLLLASSLQLSQMSFQGNSYKPGSLFKWLHCILLHGGFTYFVLSIFFYGMSVLPVCTYVGAPHVCWVHEEARRGYQIPGVIFSGSWEQPCGCWELNPDPLLDEQVLLTDEPLLQPPSHFYILCFLKVSFFLSSMPFLSRQDLTVCSSSCPGTHYVD